ncbi:DUF2231 domain-containing protein [Nocardia sp. NPDC046473]|uniref:DUF2231 domain-containing protein n=1 Tax=Nocardia sp. NPDC046473 TaxID=3155733 RepID=UPI0033FC597E
MGPTTVNDLPAHVLFVHCVVVLVPLAAVLLILAVCWPAARIRLGLITPLIAFVALVLVPLTTNSGEWLERHIPRDPLVRQHTQLGDQLLIWSAAVFLLSVAWWVMHSERATGWLRRRFHRPPTVTVHRAVAIFVAALAVVVAVGSVVQVYRIGDSGSRAVWHDRATEQPRSTPQR